MKKNFDHNIGIYIDEEECQACTYWDCCSRYYSACSKNRGWEFAVSTWQNFDKNKIVHDMGC